MQQEESTIDLMSFWRLLKNNIVLIGVISIVMALIFYFVTNMFVEEKYQSSTMLFVESSQNATGGNLNYSELSAAQIIVDTCSVIFSKNSTYEKVKAEIGDTPLYKDMVSVSSVNDTQIIRITVTSENREDCAVIANAFAKVCVEEFASIIQSGSIKIIDPAPVPGAPSYPNARKNAILGFMLGAVATYGILLLLELLNTRIKPNDDLYKMYNIPVFSEIMDQQLKESVGGKNG